MILCHLKLKRYFLLLISMMHIQLKEKAGFLTIFWVNIIR